MVAGPMRPVMAAAYAGTFSGTSSSATSFFSYEEGNPRAAFTALAARNGVAALRIMAGANNPVLADVVLGIAMGLDDNAYDFATCNQFLANHRWWPESLRNAIALQAEKKISAADSPQILAAFFDAYAPQTADGFARYIELLNASGQQQKAAGAMRKRWRETGMGEDEQRIFLDRYGRFISSADTFARLDELLWDKQYDQAEKLLPRVSAGIAQLAKARIALGKNKDNAPTLVQRVPRNLQGDPGLLNARTRWRIKHDDTAGAYALIRQADGRLGKPNEWWDERNNVARSLLDENNVNAAYDVAAHHGMKDGQEFSDAEFLAGWIALRFLGNAALAQQHFLRLNNNATAPITFARAAYWVGRSGEALGRASEAQGWFTRAASFGTTYYGQLAAARLYSSSQISASAAPVPMEAANVFENLVITRIVRELAALGEKKYAESFALAFAANTAKESDFRLMAGLALQLNMPDVAVKVAKAAAKKQIVLPVEGYPVLNVPDASKAPLIHAITRQESQFDAGISSSSNAQGLMQLLPSTARHVASKHGLSVDPSNLFDPATNVELGSTYLDELRENFSGSLPLTIASYNAGPGRVKQWIEKMGSPAGRDLDGAVDWVERIPFNETRNYVQRVMEALQLYRAKFSGGQALLGIAEDMTR